MGTPDALMLLPVLDQRLHRLPGGPLLRVVGHHAVPLPQRGRAVGPALQPGPRPRLPDRPRTWPKASSTSRCSASSTSWPRRPTSRRPPTPTATCSWSATVGPFPVTYTTGSKSTVAAAHLEDLRGSGLGRGGPARLPARGDDRRSPRVRRPGCTRRNPGTSTPAAGTCTRPRRVPRTGPGWPPTRPPCLATPLPPVQVSNIHEGTESISFNVDQTGVPVLVKTSYFPNWQRQRGQRGLPGHPQPDGRGTHRQPRHPDLRLHPGRLDRRSSCRSSVCSALVVLWRLPPVEYPTAPPPGAAANAGCEGPRASGY